MQSTCTFTGSPSATTGTCGYTKSDNLQTTTGATTQVHAVPRSERQEEIYYQSLTVYGSVSDAATATSTSATAALTKMTSAAAPAETKKPSSAGKLQSRLSVAVVMTSIVALALM